MLLGRVQRMAPKLPICLGISGRQQVYTGDVVVFVVEEWGRGVRCFYLSPIVALANARAPFTSLVRTPMFTSAFPKVRLLMLVVAGHEI